MSPLIATAVLLLAAQAAAFRPVINRATRCSSLSMSEYASQVLAAQPTIEEWLDVAEPGLKKTVLAMFRSVKEVSYKIRTASFGTIQNDTLEDRVPLRTSCYRRDEIRC